MAVPRQHRCSCGMELWPWRYTTAAGKTTGIWCASLPDLLRYQGGQAPHHDIYNLSGRQVQRGTCTAVPVTPEVA